MKKLLLALTVAVSCAFFAKADTTFNQTGFEDLTAGETLDPAKDDAGGTTQAYWSYAGDMSNMGCVISNYASGAGYTYGEGNAALVQDGPGSNYLWVDASEAPLVRNVNPFVGDGHAAQSIGDGLYFDSLVQFTATDQPPAIDATQDKLIVWLYASDETNDTAFASEVEPRTNLVVTAGYVDTASTTLASNYLVSLGDGVEVKPGEWHRLTIKAIANITKDGETYPEFAIGGFVVYVDGKAVTCDAVKGYDDFSDVGGLTADAEALGTKLFPSLIKAGTAASTLTGVAFDGTGAIDDLTFTDVDPFAVATFAYAVTVEDNDGMGPTATYAFDSAAAQELNLSGAVLAVPVNATTVTFVLTIPEDYKLAGGHKGAYDSVNETYDWTLAVAVSSLAKDGTDAITLSVVPDDGAATTYALTLTPGTGTTLSATVGGSQVNTGALVEDNAQVTITAAISDDTAYENLVVTVGGVDVTSQLVNGSYTFTMTAATTVATSASEKAPSSYSMTLTGGSNAIITYAVDGGAATTYVGTPVDVPAGSAVVITATPASGFTYSGVDITGTGWTYNSESGNLVYEISSMNDVENLVVPNARSGGSEGWPTGDALNALDGKSVSATYGIGGDLASVDAKVFTTWASGVGGIAYADRATTTYSAECFLLNIANNSSAEDIASAKAAASTAIKITAITFDGNGDPVITAPDSYGNGKVEIEGTESLAPISWHEKTDGDYFFRAKLVIDEVEDAS